MKKGVGKLTIVLVLMGIGLLLVPFVSAGLIDWFKDLFDGEDKEIQGGVGELSTLGGNPDNLKGYWKFENNIEDSSGTGNHGTNLGASFVDGKKGKALSFDGVDDKVLIGDASSLKNPAFSVSAWVYKSVFQFDHAGILEKDWEVNKGFSLTLFSGYPFFYVNGAGNDWNRAQSSEQVSLNNWHHIIGTFDGSTAKLYVNSVFKDLTATSYSSSTNPLTIGYVEWGAGATEQSYFNGIIDEVKYWDYALSEQEILEEFEGREECTDEDGGKNYSVRAAVYLGDTLRGRDGCLDGKQLKEFFCDTDYTADFEIYDCPDICTGGICVDRPEECIDSDGGLNYSIKGYVTSQSGRDDDYCEEDGTLVEYSCESVEATQSQSDIYNCSDESKICVSGRCVISEGNCIDSDADSENPEGKNYDVKGYVIPNGSLDKIWDSCKDSTNLSEQICDGEENKTFEYSCSDGCSEGRCIQAVFSIFDNWHEINPRLVEKDGSVKIKEFIEVSEAQKSLVQQTKSIKISKPSGSKETVSLSLDLGEDCYNHWTLERRCIFNYSTSYIPREIGIYSVENSSTTAIEKLKVVERGYFTANLVLDASPDYDVDYFGDYEVVDDVEELTAYYNLRNSEEIYEASVFKFSSGEMRDFYFEKILSGVPTDLISSPQIVAGENIVYVFTHPGYKITIVAWKSGNNIVLVVQDDTNAVANRRESNMNIEDFIKGLSGTSKKEIVSIDYNDAPLLLREIIGKYFDIYPSDLTAEECSPTWECQTIPVICPEHGRQTKSCEDISDCGKDDVTSEIDCQPGICSGCLVPKEYQDEVVRCIPYSFRTRLGESDVYCDFDGRIKEQKTVDVEGNLADCQNNYECWSNICSGGECIELTKMIEQSKGFKAVFVKVICKLAHLFSVGNYEECVADALDLTPDGGAGGS